jgi:LysM repeat protein
VTYQYDVNGNLVGVTDSTNGANNRSFINDISGEILQKTQGGAVERELIANGELVGTTGTGTDPDKPGTGPTPTFVDLTNFDPTYKPINGSYPAPTPGAYRIGAGDTLQGIAQAAYGDSKLWYLIADANGLSSDNDLRVGQTLNIPNRVADIHNSAGDFKPYDASSVVGSTQPNLPDPPAQLGGGGCGGMLGIIALVIVVVVTVIAQQYEALPEEAGAAGGAGAGAGGAAASGAGAVGAGGTVAGAGAASTAGSLLSTMGTMALEGAAVNAAGQLIGDALGTHHGFDPFQVLEAGVISGATAAIPGAGVGASFGAQALHGALADAMTQGVRLALHQQQSFNWMQVALSAAAAPLANQVGKFVGDELKGVVSSNADAFAQGMTTNIVNEAASGGKITLTSLATDAFGNALAVGVQDAQTNTQQEKQLEQAQQQVLGVGQQGNAVMYGPFGAAVGTWAVGTAAAGDTQASDAYGPGSLLYGPLGDTEALAAGAAANSVSGVGRGSSVFVATNGSYTVQAGDSYASIANRMFGDERYASLLMSANGIEPTYANIHGLQAGASLNLPDMGGFSEGQLSAALSHGGQMISADQRVTDERNAYALQVQARAAFASAAASTPASGTLSADDIEFASRILSQPATAGAGGAGGYVSSTFTPLGLQDRALSTDVRGGFDAYGNSTANMPQFDLGTVLTQGSIGFVKGTINSVPSTLMGLANGITQGAVTQGELEAGVDVRTALADGRQATAGWWNGQVFSYDNSVQRGFGFLGELAGPVGELKALSLLRDGIVAADLGATLDRMAYSFGTRTGTILSVTESAPTVVGEATGGARSVGNVATSTVVQVRTAAEVNQAMVEGGGFGAWGGATVTTEVVPIGTRYNMVVSEGQAQALMAGKPAFGGWATPDAIPSQAFARNDLAILSEFKPDVSFVAQVETTAPQTVNRGLVGPLGDYAGGANQVEFVGGRNLKLVGQPQSLPAGPR